MNFADLQAAVLDDTKAVQHTGLIARKCNAAVQYISRSGKYHHDVVEAFLQAADGIDEESYSQSITLPDRFRAVAYIKNSTCPTVKIRGYNVDDLAAKPSVVDVFYPSGTLLHIKTSVLTPEFYWGYYTYPATLVDGTDTNWVTEQLSDLVVDYAVAMVLVQLGEKETSGFITRFSQQNLAISARDLIDIGGRVV